MEAVAHVATVVALIILAYVHAKPSVNRWAAIRYLRKTYEVGLDDLLTADSPGGLPLRQRAARARRRLMYHCYQSLMTLPHRVSKLRLNMAFDEVRGLPDDQLGFAMSLREKVTDAEREMIVTAAVLSHAYEFKRRVRRLKRMHKGLMCSGGCGTRYGGRRHDHNFVGGSGIAGGWYCPTTESCSTAPTGKHCCGMCILEERHPDWVRRQAPPSADTPLSASKPSEGADSAPVASLAVFRNRHGLAASLMRRWAETALGRANRIVRHYPQRCTAVALLLAAGSSVWIAWQIFVDANKVITGLLAPLIVLAFARPLMLNLWWAAKALFGAPAKAAFWLADALDPETTTDTNGPNQSPGADACAQGLAKNHNEGTGELPRIECRHR